MPERNAFMWVAAILAACHLAGDSRAVGAAELEPSPGAPNILFILTDDQGWSQMSVEMQPDLSDSRSAYLHTPNMGRLAKDGMRFSGGYSPAPLCTPTRRSVLCGTSAARSGTEFKRTFVPAEHMTIPKALKGPARSLHNVRLDPGETKDLSSLDLAKAHELKGTLIGYLAGL